MTEPNTIKIDDTEYVRKDSVQIKPNGNRAVVVVDRGWIFAGDVTEENGRVYLDRAVWVFKWRSVGFDGVIKNPENDNVEIRRLQNRVDVPAGAEVFRVPVENNWGLK
jgi:hypothetical protein